MLIQRVKTRGPTSFGGPMPEAKKNAGNEKRERILEGALRAFAKKGFYNTRISEVASEAGVADGTIYLYFKNKDDVLISLFEDRMEWLIERLTTELEKLDNDVETRIRAMIRLHFELAVEQPELAEFITVELRQSSKFVKEYNNPKFYDYLSILHELIVRGQAEGVVRSDVDARLVSRLLFGALDEVLLSLTLSRAGSDDVADRSRQVANVFIQGLLAR
jgi:TetR/AcrR family fatty acid metabolism transcriptional regulator